MVDIRYIDRGTKKEEIEKVYGGPFLEFLYGGNLFSRLFSFFLRPLLAKVPFFSHFYALLQKREGSRKKIKPFIEAFHVDASEFLDPPDSFKSFNDFFIRKLKPSSRPIAAGHDIAILPADGRYLVYPNIEKCDGFVVKGKKFSLKQLLKNSSLAHKYAQGSMVLARLCPVDYHRFHFPVDCIPDSPQDLHGSLYSVNPLALKRNIKILGENKRVITVLHTKNFGTVLFIEVGATSVGSIHQTFVPGEAYAKGDEKGFFSFGGSCIILLFEPFRIEFDHDLQQTSLKYIEMRCQYGQSLGRALSQI